METPSSVIPVSPWERAFVVMVLVMSTAAFLNLRSDAEMQRLDPGQGMWFMQVFWGATYLVLFWLISSRCSNFWRTVLRQHLLLLLFVLAFLSVGWSAAPSITLRKATALFLSSLFGIYMARRFSLHEQLQILAQVCAVIIGSSVAFQLLGLGTPVGGEDSGWIGVFVHRNMLGRMMVFSTVLFCILACSRPQHKTRVWLGLLMSLALILLSTSKGSVVYVVMMLGFFALVPRLRGSWQRAVRAIAVAGFMGGTVVYFIVQNFDAFVEALGRDPNMTGRIQMWIASSLMALQRPWLGYGYQAFWGLGANGPAAGVWRLITWEAPHAHNGLLNLWLDLGLAGVALFVAGFLVSLVRAFRYMRENRSAEAVWPFMFLLFFFVSNLTESSLVDANSLFWIVYTAVFLTVSPARLNLPARRPVIRVSRIPRLATAAGLPTHLE